MKSRWIFLVLLYLVILGLRLYFALGVPGFSGDESYFSLRQVENIRHNGLPLVYDSLSYGGRRHIISPLFYYILAFFNLFMPIELVGKIIPNVIAGTIIFLSYLIALEITKNRKVALFISVTSGFVPIFFTETFNSITIYSLFFPLVLSSIYCFMNISKNKKYANYFIITMLALTLTSISSLLVVFSFLVYALLVKLENVKITKEEYEVILFSVLVVFWTQLIIYKKAFLSYGLNILFQNIPNMILSKYFEPVSMIGAINMIGIIPFFFGIYIIYKYSFKEKIKNIYLLVSFIIVVMPLLWLKLVPLIFGLLFLGLILNLLFSQYLKIFLIYMQKTKFFKFENVIISLFIILFVLTSFIPTIYYSRLKQLDSFSEDEISAMKWLGQNSRPGSTVLASYDEGNFAAYYSHIQTVIDDKFLLIENIDQRFDDVTEIYKTTINTDAIRLINKYSVDYIYLSERIKDTYNIENMEATRDKNCFRLLFENKETQIFRPLCRLEEK